MKQAVIYSAVLLGCLTMSACSKSDEKKEDPNNKTTLLASGKWKYSDAGPDLDMNGVKDSNLPPGVLAACDIDNTITFKTDKTGVIDEGALKCNTTNPQSVPFTWELKNNDQLLTISTALFPGINGDIKIVELTATKLTLSKVVPVGGFSANVIVFLIH